MYEAVSYEGSMSLRDSRMVPQSIEVVTAPTSEPVTLAECKMAARVDFTEEDPLLNSYIKQAREEVEQDASICLMPQTIRLNLDYFPAWTIAVRRRPIVSITSITYTDTDGTTQTVSSDDYRLDATASPPRIEPAYGLLWPTARTESKAVKVLMTAGYTSASLVPEIAKQAIRLRVAMHIREREGMDFEKYQAAFDSLVGKLRRFDLL